MVLQTNEQIPYYSHIRVSVDGTLFNTVTRLNKKKITHKHTLEPSTLFKDKPEMVKRSTMVLKTIVFLEVTRCIQKINLLRKISIDISSRKS